MMAWKLLETLRVVLLAAMVMVPSALAFGADQLPEGEKKIVLIAADGSEFVAGHVAFKRDGDGAKISVNLDAPGFQDEFLSMRPFRCLPHKKEMWCHLAYPYETRGRITANDLVDLEYALLFLYKPPGGYGIDAWNGLYFKLGVKEGGNISGNVHETDMNVLAVPPDDPLSRPIDHDALTSVEPDAHRFARVEIR